MPVLNFLRAFYQQTFPPKAIFNVSDIPDLSGKVVIVTGANTGIGKETAKALLLHNAKVYIACRNEQKAAQAIEELRTATGHEAIFLKLDLSDLLSVKEAAEEFLRQESELHVLINNAGVMNAPIDQLTAQGYDLGFGTNVLGHFYFTKLILPALLKGASSSADGKARVVNVSSIACWLADDIDFATVIDSPARFKKGGYFFYGQSKLGNNLFSAELARRYGEQGIVSTSLSPGSLQSDLYRYSSAFERWFLKPFLFPTEMGALTSLWAATSPDTVDLNGKFLISWARVGEGNPKGDDPMLADALWKWMEEQVEKL